MSVWEKLLLPAAGTLIFFLLSGGLMLGVGSATRGMRIILRCATLFAACMAYSMFWHEELASIFDWQNAWIMVTIVAGGIAVLLGRHWFRKGDANIHS